MATTPYFEVVPAVGGFMGRFRTRQEIIWWTETYVRKEGAIHAINLLQQHAATADAFDNV